MLESIFFALWFFAPAGIANLAAFASGKIRFLKKFAYPVDGYMKFREKRIFGSHKTVRGFVVGMLGGIITCYVQVLLYEYVPSLQKLLPLDYSLIHPVLLGTLLGLGALSGDAIKSFFKRQKGIPPGTSWVPYDQIDYILGGIVFTWFYIQLIAYEYFILFFVWLLIHPLSTFTGYLLKLRHKPV